MKSDHFSLNHEDAHEPCCMMKPKMDLKLKKIPLRCFEWQEHEACRCWKLQTGSMAKKLLREGPKNLKERGWILKQKRIDCRGTRTAKLWQSPNECYRKIGAGYEPEQRLQTEANTNNHRWGLLTLKIPNKKYDRVSKKGQKTQAEKCHKKST